MEKAELSTDLLYDMAILPDREFVINVEEPNDVRACHACIVISGLLSAFLCMIAITWC